MKTNSLHEKPRDTAASERTCESDSSHHADTTTSRGNIKGMSLSMFIHKAGKYVGEFPMMVSFMLHWPRLDHTPISELTSGKGTLNLMTGF